MSEPVKSALTPEEWAAERGGSVVRDGDYAYAPDGVSGVVVGLSGSAGVLLVLVKRERNEKTQEFTGVEDWSFWQECVAEWLRSQPPVELPAVHLRSIPGAKKVPA